MDLLSEKDFLESQLSFTAGTLHEAKAVEY